MCDCDRALELMSLQLDGMLSPAEEAELKEHLAACPDCGAAALALEALHNAMPGLVEEPPEGFHRRVMERISAQQVIPFPAKKAGSRVWKNWVSTAAVFALIILGGGGLLRAGLLGHPPGAAPATGGAPMATPAANGGTASDVAEDQAPAQIEAYNMTPALEGKEGSAKLEENTGPVAEPVAPQVAPQPAPTTARESPVPTLNIALASPVPTVGMFQGAPPAETAGPRTALQTRMPTPPELAAQQLGETQWPGAALTLLYDETGGLLGLQVDLDAERRITLACLGLTANGLYCEFQPDSQEADRFAVALDGSGILARQTDADTYDAAVSQ